MKINDRVRVVKDLFGDLYESLIGKEGRICKLYGDGELAVVLDEDADEEDDLVSLLFNIEELEVIEEK